jgi:hypothetical protein
MPGVPFDNGGQFFDLVGRLRKKDGYADRTSARRTW